MTTHKLLHVWTAAANVAGSARRPGSSPRCESAAPRERGWPDRDVRGRYDRRKTVSSESSKTFARRSGKRSMKLSSAPVVASN